MVRSGPDRPSMVSCAVVAYRDCAQAEEPLMKLTLTHVLDTCDLVEIQDQLIDDMEEYPISQVC